MFIPITQDANLRYAPLEEIMSSYITHFPFKLFIFGTKYLDVLAH